MFKRNSRRKVGNIIVDSQSLLRLSVPFFVLLISLLTLVLFIGWQASRLLLDIESLQPEVIYKLQNYTASIMNTLIWGEFLFGSLCFFLWVIYSHRVLGPMVPIRRHIQNLIKGDYDSKINLRKRDEFKNVADDLNKLAEVLKNSRGQSLIQVLISIGIMGLLTLGMVTLQQLQGKENKALTEKLAVLDAQKLVSATLADGSVCTYHITRMPNHSFQAADVTPTTVPAPINLGNDFLAGATNTSPAIITVGQSISPLINNLVATSIQLTNIRCRPPCTNPLTSDVFTADFEINFDTTSLVRAIKPIISPTTIQTVTSGGTKTIIGCQGVTSASPPSSIPVGAIMAFDLISCPSGWSDYTPAYGVFLRGIDKGTTLRDPDGTRVAGSFQNQATAKNGLRLNFSTIMTYTSNSGWGYGVNNVAFYDYPVSILSDDPETRPKNVAVLYCRKN